MADNEVIVISSDDDTLRIPTYLTDQAVDSDSDVMMITNLPIRRLTKSPTKSPRKKSRSSRLSLGTREDAIIISDGSDSDVVLSTVRRHSRPSQRLPSTDKKPDISSFSDPLPVYHTPNSGPSASTHIFGAAASAEAGPGPSSRQTMFDGKTAPSRPEDPTTNDPVKSPSKSPSKRGNHRLPFLSLDFDAMMEEYVAETKESMPRLVRKSETRPSMGHSRSSTRHRRILSPSPTSPVVSPLAVSSHVHEVVPGKTTSRGVSRRPSSPNVVEEAITEVTTGMEGVKVEPPSSSIEIPEVIIPKFSRPSDRAKAAGMSVLDYLSSVEKAKPVARSSDFPSTHKQVTPRPKTAKFDLLVHTLSPAQRSQYVPSRASSPVISKPSPGTTESIRPPSTSSSIQIIPSSPSLPPFNLPIPKDAPVSFPARPLMSKSDWRRLILSDGEAEIDLLSDETAPSSDDIDMVEDAVDRRTLLPPNQLVPSRQGKAVRDIDSPFLRSWDRLCKIGVTPSNSILRMMFESYMTESTSYDEPGADQIQVHNSVEFDGPPPDFEFVYTNQIVYGDAVPEPELGLGCNCDGPCDPRSKTCSCVKRQELYFGEFSYKGFAYNREGKLVDYQFPIWECGSTCGCPPGCGNRVIQRGRSTETKVDLFKTAKKGWGVKARNAIPRGTFVGVYAGEIITEDEGEVRGITYEKVGRTYLFDLDGWHIAHPPKRLRQIDPRLADLAEWTAQRAQVAAGGEGSGYAYSEYSIDAFHYGNFTRFFNHSCDPNLVICQAYVNDYHPERPMLAIFTRRAIGKGEELCISYKGVPHEEETPEKKKKGKQPKSSPAHVTQKHKDLVAADIKTLSKDRCYCGSRNCSGYMFNFGE